MLKSVCLLVFLLLNAVLTNAQIVDSAAVKRTDSTIISDIINPAVDKAKGEGAVPDWKMLGTIVRSRYDETYADRTITKARIYYYYGHDWALFSAALVHYTEAFENKEDLRLMNKNAKYILQHSSNPEELKTAVSWVKHAVDKEPSNAGYQQTYQALVTKTTVN